MDVSVRLDGSSDEVISGGGDDSGVAVSCYRTESVGFGRACDDETKRVEVPVVLGTSSSSVRAAPKAPWTYCTSSFLLGLPQPTRLPFWEKSF